MCAVLLGKLDFEVQWNNLPSCLDDGLFRNVEVETSIVLMSLGWHDAAAKLNLYAYHCYFCIELVNNLFI